MGLINDYQEKNDPQFRNTLQLPQIKAPSLQDASNSVSAPVVNEQPIQLDNQPQASPEPVYQPLQEMVVHPGQNIDAIINARLATQYPTLTNGASLVDATQQDKFNEWLNNTLQDRQNKAQVNSLGASLPAPSSTKSGFTQNSLRTPFGNNDYSDDGVYGNELDFSKGRFGQMGEGVLGGVFYGLNAVFGSVGASVMDTTALTAVTGTSLWDAAGAAFQLKNPIEAFTKRFDSSINNIYKGGQTFVGQVWQGRDLGAMGAYMTGDSDDDYTRLYGASPVAAALDSAFNIDKEQSNSLKEFSSLSIQRNTYASQVGETAKYVKDIPLIGGLLEAGVGVSSMVASAIPNLNGNLPKEQEQKYQSLLDKQDTGNMTRFLARQAVGFVFDTFLDLNPFDALNGIATSTRQLSVETPTQRALSGAPLQEVLQGTPERKALPGRSYAPIDDAIEVPYTVVKEQRLLLPFDTTKPTIPQEFVTYNDAKYPFHPPGKRITVSQKETTKVPQKLDIVEAPTPRGAPPRPPGDLSVSSRKGAMMPPEFPIHRSLQVQLEIPRTVEINTSSSLVSISGTAKVDKLLAGALEEPRSTIPVMRLPDAWENISEGQPLITPTTPDVVSIREKMQPLLPPAKLVVEDVSSSVAEKPTVLPEETTWNPVSEKGRVRVEVNTEDTQIRRTFTSGSAQVNEMSAVEKLRDTDLIPKVLGETLDSVTYEKLQGVPLDSVQPFDEMVQLLGNRVRQLHDKGVVHGDLHLGNVFYDAEKNTVQFIDFENAATNEALGTRAIREVQDEVGFVRDEIEAAGGNVAAFDAGYGVAPKVEVTQTKAPQNAQKIEWDKPLFNEYEVSTKDVQVTPSRDGTAFKREYTPGCEKCKVEQLAYEALSKTGLSPEILSKTDNELVVKRANGLTVKEQRKTLSKFDYEEIGKAIRQMHEQGVAHGDLHPLNVFYNKETKKTQFIDFEYAQFKNKASITEYENATWKDVKDLIRDLPSEGYEAIERGYNAVPQAVLPSVVSRAVNSGAAKKVDAGRIQVTKPETPQAKQLERQAVDLTALYGQYDARELPLLLSRAAAQPGEMTFNGKVGDISFATRSTDQILRVASLIPHPDGTGRPLLPPSTKQIAAFESKFGVPHPYKEYARSRVPTKGNIASVTDTVGQADRHKSIAHHAVENGLSYGTFYQKLLDPSGTAYPDQFIEALERGAAKGEGIVLKTGKDQYAVMSAPPKTRQETIVEYLKPESAAEESARIDSIDPAIRRLNELSSQVLLSNGLDPAMKPLVDELISTAKHLGEYNTATNLSLHARGRLGTADLYSREVRDVISNSDVTANELRTMREELTLKETEDGSYIERVQDSIIQEEKIKTTLLNVEASRQELEVLQDVIANTTPRDYEDALFDSLQPTKTIIDTLKEEGGYIDVKLNKDVKMTFELRGKDTVEVSFSIKGATSRGKSVLPLSAFKAAKKMWKRILASPAGKVKWRTGATDRDHQAALAKQEWYIKSFGFKIDDPDPQAGVVYPLILDNRITAPISSVTPVAPIRKKVELKPNTNTQLKPTQTSLIIKDSTELRSFYSKVTQEAAQGSSSSWKTETVKGINVTYKDAAQLEEYKKSTTNFPIPEHLAASVKGGIVLAPESTVNVGKGSANGLAVTGKNPFILIGSKGTASTSSTPLHETVHTLVNMITGSEDPGASSLWRQAAEIEPTFESYGKTKIAEEITTSVQLYAINPDAYKIVAPIHYELANRLYEDGYGARSVLVDNGKKLGAEECVKCNETYAAELLTYKNAGDAGLTQLALFDTLSQSQKLDALQALQFYDAHPNGFRIGSSGEFKLEEGLRSRETLQKSTGLKQVTSEQLITIVENPKYNYQTKVAATALYVLDNVSGDIKLTTLEKQNRIKEAFTQLSAIDFKARLALDELQQENKMVADELLTQYTQSITAAKQDRVKRAQQAQREVGTNAKMENEKYSSETLC